MNLEFDISMDTVQNILRRRGLTIQSEGDTSKVLFPFDQLKPPTDPATRQRLSQAQATYFELFARYSFRQFVNRLIAAGADGLSTDVIAKDYGERGAEYVRFLTEDLRVARVCADEVVLKSNVSDLGASLEHYVAHLCQEELRGRSIWGVQLAGLPSGGDFDVLAWLAPRLLYVECKSGRPSNIDERSLQAFVTRHLELGTDLSILLVDSTDNIEAVVERLNAQIEPIYETHDDVKEAYWLRRQGVQFKIPIESMKVLPSESYPTIWFGYHRLYAVNAKPQILTQIQRCLSHHNAHMKQMDLLIAKSFAH